MLANLARKKSLKLASTITVALLLLLPNLVSAQTVDDLQQAIRSTSDQPAQAKL